MARQVTVKVGDTVADIARQFNVPTSAVKGFRSNNPNQIFPGETLTIEDTAPAVNQQPLDLNTQTTTSTPAVSLDTNINENIERPVTPDVPTGPQIQQEPPVIPSVDTPPETSLDLAAEEPLASSFLDDDGAPEEGLPDDFFTTPSGAVVDEEGTLIERSPQQQQADQLFGQFGITTEEVQQGFVNNPFGTISDVVAEVMGQLNLPDIRAQVNDLSAEIESLENERDTQIEDINDDPFKSTGSKRVLENKVRERFENRIRNRVNRLTLLQNAQQNARQQAQFAATTAVNLFGRQQQFRQDVLDRILDEQERVAEAERKIAQEEREIQLRSGPLAAENINGFTVLRDGTGKVISVVKPADSKSARTIAQKVAEIPLEQGDPSSFLNMLRATSGGKPPVAGERGSLTKAFLVVDQIDTLTSLTDEVATGPIIGIVRSRNPYDSKAQQIKAQLTQIVPNLARGVFGEVGVLTDNDVALYSRTLPNLTNPTDIRDAIAGLTLRTVQRSIENQLEVLGASGIDVSGFENKYNRLINTISRTEDRLGIGTENTPSEDEAIFDEVVGTRSDGNYLQNLWAAIIGA